MGEPPSAPEWLLKREPQVLGLFRDHRRKRVGGGWRGSRQDPSADWGLPQAA